MPSYTLQRSISGLRRLLYFALTCPSEKLWDNRRTLAFMARQFVASSTILIAMTLLSGCPKKQWSYTPPPAPAATKDFDVHFDPDHLDPNGAPRNIDWQPQEKGRIPDPNKCNDGQPYSSACTQDKPFQDQPDGLHEAFCFVGKLISAINGSPIQTFFGHADWMVAQYDGSIDWLNFAADSDYNLLLIPQNLALGDGNEHGITTNNNHIDGDSKKPQYIEVEWNSDETDAAFGKPNSWWAQFKEASQAKDTQQLARLLHPRDEHTLPYGSVVGLFGLDCDHGCRSELHPVYALAIQRTEDLSDNEWSILVRNWGTGGFCSQYNDELAESSLSLVLSHSSPKPPTSVEVQDFQTTAASGPGLQCPRMYYKDGQTILNLTMPPPDKQGVATFSLKIQWPAGAQLAAGPGVRTLERAPRAVFTEAPEPSTHLRGEDYMGALLRGATQGQHLNLEKDILPAVPKMRANFQALPPMTLSPQSESCNATIQVIPGLPQPAPVATVHRLRKDSRKRIRDEILRSYICQQYRTRRITPPVGTQQDLDQACKGVK